MLSVLVRLALKLASQLLFCTGDLVVWPLFPHIEVTGEIPAQLRSGFCWCLCSEISFLGPQVALYLCAVAACLKAFYRGTATLEP